MTRLREILRDRKGNGFPLAIAITLALVIIFCGISEYIRLLIIAQGVRDAMQTAVISTVNDNYDDVYHGVREGYSGGYQPMAGDFEESLDYGDIYGRLEEVLGLSYQGGTRVKFTEDGKTVFITVENKFIRGDIKGYKVDEDGKSVVGALFGLFTEDDTEFTEENAVLTAVSDADGIFTFKNVLFGKWIVRELKPAEGFVLNETEFPVDITTDGAVIEIKAENRHIYGAVHTTKVDKDYPDHLLTGAVFEVYCDINGNQQFDPDVDGLVGTLSECEPGLYELAELRYGGYFLYEKQAPVNFIKDNGYHYFEIVTDGEMVEVENKAGVGFINDHMVGNLKIVKTSSDGRVDGFSFRVTGENYDEVFTTDANGEIFIKNLRIGKYTVTEVEDSVSTGYKRPAPFEIELTADETLTVNVHNDKVTTDHPDSPKTGDNSHMALWVSLMLASLGVLIVTILYSRKKKHLAG